MHLFRLALPVRPRPLPAPVFLLPAVLLPVVLLLAGCAADSGFPSLAIRPGEAPRQIEPPGAGRPPHLSAAQQQQLEAGLAEAGTALAAARAAFDSTFAAASAAVGGSDGAAPGSAGWAARQAWLSRLQQKETAFTDVEARLAPLRLLADGLPADDSGRQALDRLLADLAAARSAAGQRLSAFSGAIPAAIPGD